MEVVSLVDLVVVITLYTVANRARARWMTVAVTGALLAGVFLANLFLPFKSLFGDVLGNPPVAASDTKVADPENVHSGASTAAALRNLSYPGDPRDLVMRPVER